MKSKEFPNIVYIVVITAIAALGGFLFGYDFGVINGTVKALELEFNSNAVGTGFNVASIVLGCIPGALYAGYFADKFGRRAVMFSACFFFALSAWGSGIASGSVEFVIYRIIGGIGVGAASAICPAYICEIAPAKIRGALASAQQMAIVLGIFFAFLVNYLIANFAGDPSGIFAFGFKAWQWMFWAEIAPTVAFFLGLFFIPESPRFLAALGRDEDAKNILSKIYFNADEEVVAIKKSLGGVRPSVKDIFKENSFMPHGIIIVGVLLAISQQFTGMNIIMNYGEVLWGAIGFDKNSALLQNVITGVVNVLSTIVAILLIDKIGRKVLLLAGSFLMCLSLGAMGFIFSKGHLENSTLILPEGLGVTAFIIAMVFVFAFAATWGPVLWVLLGEMFPNSMRASGIALSAAAVWAANFAVVMTFPSMLENMGLAQTYFLYAIFPMLSFIFVKFYVKETKNLELENMKED